MIRLWGRNNSMNVQKVLWTLDELGLRYERLDAGMQFGINNTPDYLQKNPNGKVPLLEDDGYAIWESQAICRYLCNQYQGSQLYPWTRRPGGRLTSGWIGPIRASITACQWSFGRRFGYQRISGMPKSSKRKRTRP